MKVLILMMLSFNVCAVEEIRKTSVGYEIVGPQGIREINSRPPLKKPDRQVNPQQRPFLDRSR